MFVIPSLGSPDGKHVMMGHLVSDTGPSFRQLTPGTCEQVIVPSAAVMREGVDKPVDTLYWMRESELKHGRIAQLAGEICPLRKLLLLPFVKYNLSE